MAEISVDMSSVLEQKALALFKECDLGSKGYLTKSDFAHLNTELQLTGEAINQVFDSLADQKHEGVAVISPNCFVSGFGAFFRCAGRRLSSISASREDLSESDSVSSPVPWPEISPRSKTTDDTESGVSSTSINGNALSLNGGYEIDSSEWDPAFTEMLNQLSANGIEPQEDGFAELWQRLEREDPNMLATFEKFLRKVTGELSQTKSYCKSLALLLRQKVAEHDETVTTLHDELEDHVKQETERLVAQLRAHELSERRSLERELEERENVQFELSTRLAALEARERELSNLVEASKAEARRLLMEKQSLEVALSNRFAAEADNAALNERMRSVQEELTFHQNSFSSEMGRLQAERDVLHSQLEEVSRHNSLLRQERLILNSPMVLNKTQSTRKLPSSSLLMLGIPSAISHGNSGNHSHRRSNFIHQSAFPLRSATSPVGSAVSCHSESERGLNSCGNNSRGSSTVNGADEFFCDGGHCLPGHANDSTCCSSVCANNNSLDTIKHSVKTASNTSLEEISPFSKPDAKSSVVPLNNVPHHKVVFLGDSGVGKTAILHRLCYDQFKPAFNATIGMDLHTYSVDLGDENYVMLQCWDTAGQERYRSMTRQYFRNAHAFVLVYDISCEASFLSCRWWLEEIGCSTSNGNNKVVLLLGNKVDRASDGRAVLAEQARFLAMDQGLMFAEVSAQTGFGVHEVISQVAVHLLQGKHLSSRKRNSTASSANPSLQGDVVSLQERTIPKQKNSCLPSCGSG